MGATNKVHETIHMQPESSTDIREPERNVLSSLSDLWKQDY